MTFVRSEAYGMTVALGPTQEAVYRFVMGATAGGRRPEYTLGELAERTGRPVSSVHEALGRLRALGLIGFTVRMGRTGGHRLWRVASRAAGSLDIARHRRAVARVLRRWRSSVLVATEVQRDASPASLWTDPSGGTGESKGDEASGLSSHLYPVPPGPSFGERVRRYGRLPWDKEPATDDDSIQRSSDGDHHGPGGASPGIVGPVPRPESG